MCVVIAPYAEGVRGMIEQYGRFAEVYVAMSVHECERHDRKGHYSPARMAQMRAFTGISGPCETPETPERTIDAVLRGSDCLAQAAMPEFESLGLIN